MNTVKMAQSSLLTATVVAGGFISSFAQEGNQKSTPKELVDALHTAFGNNHSRAVHAKGIILEGIFTPDEGAATLTKAAHLQKQASKVTVRFSDFTGIPNIPDNIGAANPRGLAIKFTLPDGTTTNIISHSFNGFPTVNSDQFWELLLAIGASGADASKPTQLDATNTSEADKQLSFIPNHIPDGIETADPMLNFRSNAYPISVKERQ